MRNLDSGEIKEKEKGDAHFFMQNDLRSAQDKPVPQKWTLIYILQSPFLGHKCGLYAELNRSAQNEDRSAQNEDRSAQNEDCSAQNNLGFVQNNKGMPKLVCE